MVWIIFHGNIHSEVCFVYLLLNSSTTLWYQCAFYSRLPESYKARSQVIFVNNQFQLTFWLLQILKTHKMGEDEIRYCTYCVLDLSFFFFFLRTLEVNTVSDFSFFLILVQFSDNNLFCFKLFFFLFFFFSLFLAIHFNQPLGIALITVMIPIMVLMIPCVLLPSCPCNIF